MKQDDATWRDTVGAELAPLLAAADASTLRIKQRVAALVDELPKRLPPLHAVDRVRSGALSAASPAAAAEVAGITREADEQTQALDLSLAAGRKEAARSPKVGYRLVGFVWESAGLAIGWVAAVVTLVLARGIGADTMPIGTATAIAGYTALSAAVVCAALEKRRAASLVIVVREGASPYYAALALFWIVGLVTTAVRVVGYDEVLGARGTFGLAAWVVALAVMIVLVIASATTDRLKGATPPLPPDHDRNRHTVGINAVKDMVRTRERGVFTALPADLRDAVLAGELEGIRLLLTGKRLSPQFARAAVLDVRDRRRSGG